MTEPTTPTLTVTLTGTTFVAKGLDNDSWIRSKDVNYYGPAYFEVTRAALVAKRRKVGRWGAQWILKLSIEAARALAAELMEDIKTERDFGDADPGDLAAFRKDLRRLRAGLLKAEIEGLECDACAGSGSGPVLRRTRPNPVKPANCPTCNGSGRIPLPSSDREGI
jgi:hypothetical protein